MISLKSPFLNDFVQFFFRLYLIERLSHDYFPVERYDSNSDFIFCQYKIV